MAHDKEAFLSRWSRLKREEAAKEDEAPAVPAPQEAAEDDPAPPLPPVEELTPESDFTPFMHAKVPLATRRAALKKLFADPQFGLPDPYEAYSEDWTIGEKIPPEMLRGLNQAKKILFDEPAAGEAKPVDEAVAQDGQAEDAENAENPENSENVTREDDGTGRKDA